MKNTILNLSIIQTFKFHSGLLIAMFLAEILAQKEMKFPIWQQLLFIVVAFLYFMFWNYSAFEKSKNKK